VIAACEYCGESFECAKTPYRVHKKPAQRFAAQVVAASSTTRNGDRPSLRGVIVNW
jgi:hypothetical protein